MIQVFFFFLSFLLTNFQPLAPTQQPSLRPVNITQFHLNLFQVSHSRAGMQLTKARIPFYTSRKPNYLRECFPKKNFSLISVMCFYFFFFFLISILTHHKSGFVHFLSCSVLLLPPSANHISLLFISTCFVRNRCLES